MRSRFRNVLGEGIKEISSICWNFPWPSRKLLTLLQTHSLLVIDFSATFNARGHK